MKIKLAILEKDAGYLQRIVSVFGTKYADKIEIYSFTDLNLAMQTLSASRIDVFVANDSFDINFDLIPKRCGFAYFVDSADIDTQNGQRAICKFQKIDLIYKQILSIFAENAGNVSGMKLGDDSAKVIAFVSPCGGVGTSSMAVACAMRFAKQGKKTLYLNIEKLGSSDLFFSAEGQFDMSDIVFALKTKKANISLKLESCVKQDQSGVFFYSQPKIALDMMELNGEDIIRLVSELKLVGSYDYIIVDMDFILSRETINQMNIMDTILMVSDGSLLANSKVFRAFSAFMILDENSDTPITSKMSLVYNKFSNKTGKSIEGIDIKEIGGAPRYEHASTEQVVKTLSDMSFFDKI